MVPGSLPFAERRLRAFARDITRRFHLLHAVNISGAVHPRLGNRYANDQFGFLVGRENVLAQSEAGVKKRPVLLVGRVEILNQAQQSQSVEACEFRLNICPCRM